MKRRDFMFGGAAVIAAAQLPAFASKAAAAVPNRLIDAHCHIFNADDLPVTGFAEKVVLSGHPDIRDAFRQMPHIPQFLIRFLGDWVQGRAFTADQENAHLDRVKADPTEARDADRIREDEIDHLADLIDKLTNLRVKNKNFTAGERIFGFYVPGVVIGMLYREAFPVIFRGKGINDNSDGAFNPSNWSDDPRYLAQHVYNEGRGQISRYLRWGLRLTRYRSELVDELASIHGGKAKLVTPALIDYSHWLNDKHDVKLEKQIGIMARLAQRAGATRVHGYSPFDPLREAMHRIAPEQGAKAPLALAQLAVTEKGFIGVKLYPPMGFRPLGNEGFSTGDFPQHIHKPFKGRKIGKDIEAVLNELYTWCAAEDVPILAHASDSNGSAPGYSARANPDYWAAVIAKYPTLRLSLAHFGDFDEGFKSDKIPNPKLSGTWEWKIAKLIKDHPNSLIFADVSYFRAAMLESKNNVRKEVVRMFLETRKSNDLLVKRMIFGSDWIMLGQEERFGELVSSGHYAGRVDDILEEFKFTSAERNAVMFANPAAFLGLDKADAAVGNRVRLKEFYAANGLSDAWLDEMVA